MNYQKACAASVYDAIPTWPAELSTIVAAYAAPDVRWLPNQSKVRLSADRKVAHIEDHLQQDVTEYVDNYGYMPVVGDRPVKDMPTDWRLEIEVEKYSGVSYRIGVRHQKNNLYLCPRIQFDQQNMKLHPVSDNGSITVLPPKRKCRFVVAADLVAGSLSIRPEDAAGWFSVTIPPDVLAASFPVVYLYAPNDCVRLIS
jgi:hypothetical protein